VVSVLVVVVVVVDGVYRELDIAPIMERQDKTYSCRDGSSSRCRCRLGLPISKSQDIYFGSRNQTVVVVVVVVISC
jgi:hypothetical protein